MNCDMAFDLMTDAKTAGSSALARHLESCPRCRQMQETLAPALSLLSQDAPVDPSPEYPSAAGEAGVRARQPMVTVEALKIAEQAATRLTAPFETPHVRLKRLAGRSIRYAAAFAGGLLLAVTVFATRDAEVPNEENCTRRDAGRNDIERSAAEIRALALSCAACHDASHPMIERRSTSLEPRRAREFDWVRPLLAGETLLALCEHPVSACSV